MSSDGSYITLASSVLGDLLAGIILTASQWYMPVTLVIKKVNLSLELPNELSTLNISTGGKIIQLFVPTMQLLDITKLQLLTREELLKWLSDPSGNLRLFTIPQTDENGNIPDSDNVEIINKNIEIIYSLLGLGEYSGDFTITEDRSNDKELVNRGLSYRGLSNKVITINEKSSNESNSLEKSKSSDSDKSFLNIFGEALLNIIRKK